MSKYLTKYVELRRAKNTHEQKMQYFKRKIAEYEQKYKEHEMFKDLVCREIKMVKNGGVM